MACMGEPSKLLPGLEALDFIEKGGQVHDHPIADNADGLGVQDP